MAQPSFALNDGTRIPFLAFGTGTALFDKDATRDVATAITKGLVHLDGAQVYKNEETLGAGIAASAVPRESLYVTTKLGPLAEGQTPKDTLIESLKKLKLDYVDLFLIHLPRVHHVGKIQQVWKGMEEVKSSGLAKSIGVSNCGFAELEQILEIATIVPAVNQLEFHPYFYTVVGPIYEFGKKHGILTTSYGGLSPVVRAKGGPLDPVLTTIRDRLASESGKSVTEGQVLGRWLLNKGVVFISTTSKEERLDEYLGIASLPDLTPEEVKLIEETGAKHLYQRYSTAFPQDTPKL